VLAWLLLSISAGILLYNWSCVAIYRTGRSDVPKFVHYVGSLPAAFAIGFGITPFPPYLWWVPPFLDPAGAIYLLAFLRYMVKDRSGN
jgi:hypothetical protein